MQSIEFAKKTDSLLAIYEQNYMLFRLVLPKLPTDSGWFMLTRQGLPNIYVSRISIHRYTSEWIIGHFFDTRKHKKIAPNYTIRVYHDARLAEVMITKKLPIKALKEHKLEMNRALLFWLNYCHRRSYKLANNVELVQLPNPEDIAHYAKQN